MGIIDDLTGGAGSPKGIGPGKDGFFNINTLTNFFNRTTSFGNTSLIGFRSQKVDMSDRFITPGFNTSGPAQDFIKLQFGNLELNRLLEQEKKEETRTIELSGFPDTGFQEGAIARLTTLRNTIIPQQRKTVAELEKISGQSGLPDFKSAETQNFIKLASAQQEINRLQKLRSREAIRFDEFRLIPISQERIGLRIKTLDEVTIPAQSKIIAELEKTLSQGVPQPGRPGQPGQPQRPGLRDLARLGLNFTGGVRPLRLRTGQAGGFTFAEQAKEQDLIIPPGFTSKQPTTSSRAIDPNILNGVR